MRKLLILPVFLLFAACPEKMIPDGGGTIKNFQMTETESEYRFTWDAVDLSEYKARNSYKGGGLVYNLYGYSMSSDKKKSTELLVFDSAVEPSVTVKKKDVDVGEIRFVVKCDVGTRCFISRQIDVTVDPSAKMTPVPIGNFRYETTDFRYLFLWDDIDFDEYRKAAGDAAANDAEQQLFYTLKLTDDAGKTVFEKSSGRNPELSVEKSLLPSGTCTAEVFYKFLVSGDPADVENVIYRGETTLTVSATAP